MTLMKMIYKLVHSLFPLFKFDVELDALGDELLFEEESAPTYLEEPTKNPELPSTSMKNPNIPVNFQKLFNNVNKIDRWTRKRYW